MKLCGMLARASVCEQLQNSSRWSHTGLLRFKTIAGVRGQFRILASHVLVNSKRRDN